MYNYHILKKKCESKTPKLKNHQINKQNFILLVELILKNSIFKYSCAKPALNLKKNLNEKNKMKNICYLYFKTKYSWYE